MMSGGMVVVEPIALSLAPLAKSHHQGGWLLNKELYMKVMKIVLLTIGLGGGALWLGVRESGAVPSSGGCADCWGGECHPSNVDFTCKADRTGCVATSGCVFL